MKCKYCNAEVAPNARFCTSCGGDLSKFDKCVNCGEFIDKEESICPHCGTEQPKIVLNEKGGSKKVLWIICAILLLVVLSGVGYYFVSNDGIKESDSSYIETNSNKGVDNEVSNDIEDVGESKGIEGLISFEDALRVAEEMIIKDGDFKGFRSPDNVNNIMDKYGYKRAGKYYVDREFLFELLYYKNCSLGKSLGDNCYSEVPLASGNGSPSFLGIDQTGLVISAFNRTVFDEFINQTKEFGATLKENDNSTISYNYLNYEIVGFKDGVYSIRYCILISKEDD